MRVVFTRVPEGESTVRIFRNDGVVVDLPSYSRKHRIPHDLAHAVTERELRISRGIFGSIAAGALFSNAKVVAGKLRHDSAARSMRILKAHSGELGMAELLGGIMHLAVEHRMVPDAPAQVRRQWGAVSAEPCPFAEADLRRAAATLDRLGHEWGDIAVGGELEFFWPDSLVPPVPPAEKSRAKARTMARR